MANPTSARLPDFPVVITLPVQWGDQDAFGHVNNTIYFRWYESARIAYTAHVGLMHLLTQDRIGPILAAINCNYRRPIVFPDTVEVGARITRIGRTSLQMEHQVYSLGMNAVVADGDSTIVVYNYANQKSHPVPDPIRQAIEQLEGKTL